MKNFPKNVYFIGSDQFNQVWRTDQLQGLFIIWSPSVGGLFEYVSGANFLGEITEWAGFALAGHSVHSTSFSIFTLVVLASRAVAHHRWDMTPEINPKTHNQKVLKNEKKSQKPFLSSLLGGISINLKTTLNLERPWYRLCSKQTGKGNSH